MRGSRGGVEVVIGIFPGRDIVLCGCGLSTVWYAAKGSLYTTGRLTIHHNRDRGLTVGHHASPLDILETCPQQSRHINPGKRLCKDGSKQPWRGTTAGDFQTWCSTSTRFMLSWAKVFLAGAIEWPK